MFDTQHVLPIVVSELSSVDLRRRDNAYLALLCSDTQVGYQRLVDGLFHDEEREKCQECLKWMTAAAQPLVRQSLTSDAATDPVIEAACEILLWRGTEESLEELKEVAAGESSARERAGQAVARIEKELARPEREKEEERRTLRTKRRWFHESLRSSLASDLERLRTRNPPKEAWYRAEPVPVTDALRQAASSDPEVRLQGMHALLECELDPHQRDAVVAAARKGIDPNDTPLAWFALQAYSRWAGEEAVPVVLPYVEGDNPYLVVAAATGLADIGSVEALGSLVRLLHTPGHELTGRLALLRAGATNAEQVAELVQPVLQSDSRRTRIEAAVVLARLGLPDVMAAVEAAVDGDPALAPLREFYKAAHQSAERARPPAERRSP
jgi:HEAT repeat protein